MTQPDAAPAALPAGEAVARLEAARAAFAALVPGVAAGEPWPLAEAFGTEPEASWGPREVLAHTAEMLPFWLGEWERIAEAGRTADDPLPFGRTAADALRIGILDRDRSLPLRELFARIEAGIGRWIDRTRAARPEEGAAVGLHSRLGPMTADRMRDRFVVEHLDEHAAQLDEALRA